MGFLTANLILMKKTTQTEYPDMEYYLFIDKETGDHIYYRRSEDGIIRIINTTRKNTYSGQARPGITLVTEKTFDYILRGYMKRNNRHMRLKEISKSEFNKGLAKARESLMI